MKAFSDFTAQFVYASPDGTILQKSIHVQLSDEAASTQLYTDNGVATLVAGPTPPYATGKITSIAKEGGTWLIWFNGQEAYCCSHGLNGQPNGCPTYAFDHVSRLEPGQYTPGKMIAFTSMAAMVLPHGRFTTRYPRPAPVHSAGRKDRSPARLKRMPLPRLPKMQPSTN